MSIDIDWFAEKMLEEEGWNTPSGARVDSRAWDTAHASLVRQLKDRMDCFIRAHLEPYQIRGYERVLVTGDFGLIQDWARNEIHEFDHLLAAEVVRFKAEYFEGRS